MRSRGKKTYIILLTIFAMGFLAVYNAYPTSDSCVNDYMVNYIRGTIRVDGGLAPGGTNYNITVISGTNAGYSYNGTADDGNVPSWLNNKGYFSTDDQKCFNSGDTFSVLVPGYEEMTQGTFVSGGNGEFGGEGVNLSVSIPYTKKISYSIVDSEPWITVYGKVPVPGLYLDDFSVKTLGSYTGVDPYGITTNGSFIWISDWNNYKVHKLDMDGNYIESWDAPSGAGLTTDNTYIWFADGDNGAIVEYDMDGVATGRSCDISATTYPDSITHNNTHWFVTDWTQNVYLFKINSVNDCSLETTYDLSAQTSAIGAISIDDDNYVYIGDYNSREILKYNPMTYTGLKNTIYELGYPSFEGIANYGDDFWILDNINKAIYKVKNESAYNYEDIAYADLYNYWNVFTLDAGSIFGNVTYKSKARINVTESGALESGPGETLIFDYQTLMGVGQLLNVHGWYKAGTIRLNNPQSGTRFLWDLNTLANVASLIEFQSGSTGYIFGTISERTGSSSVLNPGTHITVDDGASVTIKNPLCIKGSVCVRNYDVDTVIERATGIDMRLSVFHSEVSNYVTPPTNLLCFNCQRAISMFSNGEAWNVEAFGSASVDVYCAGTANCTVINSNLSIFQAIWSANKIYVNYTLDARIVNNTGNPIPGVDCSTYDVDGNLLYSDLTDSDGRIDQQMLTYRKYSLGTNVIEKEYTPHRFVCTHASYQTYEVTWNLTQQVIDDQPIALIP